MQYYLMRKDTAFGVAEIDVTGEMLKYKIRDDLADLAPLMNKSDPGWIRAWWQKRSIPLSQDGVAEMLRDNGYDGPAEYLTHNLGLSLTDYYWIKPVGSSLRWKQVNLFDNDFGEIISKEESTDRLHSYTPNSTLQGQLEKKWIIRDGKRLLIKGNRDRSSLESLNEYVASLVHYRQGYDNYTPYHLVRISNRSYVWGCYSEAFTDERKELVSAYAVVTSEKKRQDVSSYEHFIELCAGHGIDKEQLRRDLEYQILTDYILSNPDRHLSNISVLRDADTLQFLRMAPIYDTGKAFMAGLEMPASDREIMDIRVTSFAARETKLLEYVQDRSLVDLTKLPTISELRQIYEMDPELDRSRINAICSLYEKKIDLCRQFQLGKSPYEIRVSMASAVQGVREETPAWGRSRRFIVDTSAVDL
ncbi:MAG: HipA domain-containing protein [Lachnospiraceae bacterium]|nr:HipA domain-containing protein [Lachnospiraceae bacterium]